MINIHDFPSSLYQEMRLFRIRKPMIAWKHSQIDEGALLRRFAYARPLNDDETGFFDECDHKIGLADRYGGMGIGRAKGSGRCCLLDGSQIKGVGITPLIPVSTASDDEWHMNGALSLSEAIQELVWSHALRDMLPHGSTKVIAIILVGSKTRVLRVDGSVDKEYRAILIRSFQWRLGHFLRNCSLGREQLNGIEDSIHVTRMIECLSQGSTNHDVTILKSGYRNLPEVTRRLAFSLASQFAVAHSSRIIHGAVTPSNLALDGSWVDFGTTTHLASFRNVGSLGAPRRLGSLWQEGAAVRHILMDFAFQIGRYGLDNSQAFRPEECGAIFSERYSHEISSRLMYPFRTVPSIDSFIQYSNAWKNASNALCRVATEEQALVLYNSIEKEKEDLAHARDLMLTLLNRCDLPHLKMPGPFMGEVFRATFRKYFDFAHEAAIAQGLNWNFIKVLMTINIIKFFGFITLLGRNELRLASITIAQDHVDLISRIQPIMRSSSDQTKLLADASTSASVILWSMDGCHVTYNSSCGKWCFRDDARAGDDHADRFDTICHRMPSSAKRFFHGGLEWLT